MVMVKNKGRKTYGGRSASFPLMGVDQYGEKRSLLQAVTERPGHDTGGLVISEVVLIRTPARNLFEVSATVAHGSDPESLAYEWELKDATGLFFYWEDSERSVRLFAQNPAVASGTLSLTLIDSSGTGARAMVAVHLPAGTFQQI